jgi:hypothetical protein
LDILNDDGTVIGEVGKVRFEGQVIVKGLDVGGQDLTTTGDVGRARHFSASSTTHPAIGTVTFGSLREGSTTKRRAMGRRDSRRRRGGEGGEGGGRSSSR